MGVIVSAVATGLIHNIQADCQKKNEANEPASKKLHKARENKIVRVITKDEGIDQKFVKTQQQEPPPTAVKIKKDASTHVTPEPPPPPPEKLYPEPTPSVPASIAIPSPVECVELDQLGEGIKIETKILPLERQSPPPKDVSDGENDNSLPVVSLLPTLTEEITLTLSRSAPENSSGWFRKNFTSIDTVQKIYGTPLSSASRRSSSARSRAQSGSTLRSREWSSRSSRTSSQHDKPSVRLKIKRTYSPDKLSPRTYFSQTGNISQVSSPSKDNSIVKSETRLKNKHKADKVVILPNQLTTS